ncbi:hypothetical protein [Desulfonatronum thioautotrophicum]|uniref:hypothetical protein n=1 Tax=Desulfonatronum thioautotrophicum TaxID=617001 RepID=UPI0012947BFC|nr:hypothetical protein [Desulfonatronum thioautotrophicum]
MTRHCLHCMAKAFLLSLVLLVALTVLSPVHATTAPHDYSELPAEGSPIDVPGTFTAWPHNPERHRTALLSAANTPKLTHRVSLFTGKFTTQSMGDTASFWSVDFEENYLVALAYAQDMLDLGHDLRLGPEIGIAGRFGCRWSTEIWAGAALRHGGVVLFDHLHIEPAFTLGLSWIDRSIGIERTREETQNGDATLLVYLGPELAFASPRHPQWAFVYRLHHRSGAFRTFGNLKGGHNANTIGLRYSF